MEGEVTWGGWASLQPHLSSLPSLPFPIVRILEPRVLAKEWLRGALPPVGMALPVIRQTLTPSVPRHWMDKTVTRPWGRCQLVPGKGGRDKRSGVDMANGKKNKQTLVCW